MPFPRFFRKHRVRALPLPELVTRAHDPKSAEAVIVANRRRREEAMRVAGRMPPKTKTYAASIPDLGSTMSGNTVLRMRLPGREGLYLFSMLCDSKSPNLLWGNNKVSSYLQGPSKWRRGADFFLLEVQLNAKGFMMDFPSAGAQTGGVVVDLRNEYVRRLLTSRNRARAESKDRNAMYIDFILEMPPESQTEWSTGSLTVSMEGGGEVTVVARRFKPDRAEDLQITPITSWVDEQFDKIQDAIKKAEDDLNAATSRVQREEIKRIVDELPELTWGYKCAINGQFLLDAMFEAKRQSILKGHENPLLTMVRTRDPPESIKFRLKIQKEWFELGVTKPLPWDAAGTGIQVPMTTTEKAFCYFDLYQLDRLVGVPLLQFSRKWKTTPLVHFILGGDQDGNTPAIVIFPIGQYSFMAAVLPNNKPKKS